MSQKTTKKPQKPKVYLSDDGEGNKPIKTPWVMICLLILGIVLTLWKYHAYDPEAERLAQQENLKIIQEYKQKQQSLQERTDKIKK